MNVDDKRVIGLLSPPPSAFTEDVVFTDLRDIAELRCRYERNGLMYAGGLRFRRAFAYRFRAEPYCTVWHIEDAYDAVVEVEHSSWIEELRTSEATEVEADWRARHFLIYVDGAGAYEVIADDVEWLTEEVLL